jgi:thiol-disulfide isomerase/thioredoxin
LLLIGAGLWMLVAQILSTPETVRGTAYARQDALPGQPASNFELANVAGQPVKLSDFKGHPVILNFWATWCAPCREEFPELQFAAEAYGDSLTIIGINHTSGDDPDLVPDFVAEYGITFPVLLDELGLVVEIYGVVGLPTTVFIDRQGVINQIITGPINKAVIEQKLTEL